MGAEENRTPELGAKRKHKNSSKMSNSKTSLSAKHKRTQSHESVDLSSEESSSSAASFKVKREFPDSDGSDGGAMPYYYIYNPKDNPIIKNKKQAARNKDLFSLLGQNQVCVLPDSRIESADGIP